MTITAACMTISVTTVSYFVTFITAIVANPAETVKNGGVSAVSVVIGNKKPQPYDCGSFTSGQSEIRTRGGLHLNGFQDRLFRPLRHLPFAPNIAATHETPIYHSARKCDTWHSLHPRRFQQKTAHASAQNDTNGTGTVQHTKSGAGTNANAAFTDSYQTRTSWKIRLPTWSAR